MKFMATEPPDGVVRGLILREAYSKYQEDPFDYIDKTKIKEKTGIVIEKIIDRNIKYLEEKGLVKSSGLPGGNSLAQITAYGIDVISNKDNLAKFRDTFSIDFGQIIIEGDVNAPIIIGHNINVTDSFNQLRSIAENKKDVSEEERNEIINKIEELEIAISQESIHKPTIKKLKDFFSKYSDLIPLVTAAITTALSQI